MVDTLVGNSRFAQRLICAVGISGALAAAGSFLFVLPIARFGIFDRLEIVVIGLFGAGAACAFCLAGLPERAAAARRAFSSPLVWILAGLALWSMLVAPMAEYPLRSFLGPPQTGQGILALISLAGIAGVIAALGTDRRAHLALVVAISAGALVSVVTHAGPAVQRPFEVPVYFVLLGLAAAAAIATLRLPRRQRYALAIGVLGLTLAVSENRSAFAVILLIGIPSVWIGEIAVSRGFSVAVRSAGIAATLVLPFVITAIVWSAGSAGYGASIVARARIYDVLFAAFVDRPGAVLFGFGWGGVIEAFFRHLPSGAEFLYGESWDVPVRDFNSAHNLALEFFVSAGVPGLIAAIMLPAIVVATAPKRLLAPALGFAVTLAALSVTWHQQSFNLGPTIVACALLSRAPRLLGGSIAIRISAVAVGGALLACGFWLADYGWRARESLAGLGGSACLEGFPNDPARGDMGLRYALYGLTERVRQGRGPADGPAQLAAISCAVDSRFAVARSVHLALAATLYRSELAFDPGIQVSGQDISSVLETWPTVLYALLDSAPRRSDLAVPYLAWLAKSADTQRLLEASTRLLERSPQDIVGLWFSGLALIGSPDATVRQKAVFRMRMALAGGFNRILPVNPDIINKINGITP